jgi:hypothetical protein
VLPGEDGKGDVGAAARRRVAVAHCSGGNSGRTEKGLSAASPPWVCPWFVRRRSHPADPKAEGAVDMLCGRECLQSLHVASVNCNSREKSNRKGYYTHLLKRRVSLREENSRAPGTRVLLNTEYCLGCLFLRSPSRIPYRTELIPRGPVTHSRVPDREEKGKPINDARRGRCHPLE